MEKLSKRSRISLRRVLFVSLVIVGLSIFSSMRISSTTVSYDPQSYSSLTPHDSISITSDSGFAVFPGSGTEEDPYLIEGYNITTTSNRGISITDTTKYFIVRNCYVDVDDYGIYIDNVADGTATIINNTCSNNNFGISLNYFGSSTVVNNTCNNNNGDGIRLWYSGSSTVVNNTCSNNGDEGILLWDSGSSTVINNTCNNNNFEGIMLSYSSSSIVVNNTCSNNNSGIKLSSSNNSTVINNTCNYNQYGIMLVTSGSSTVADNTCNNDYHGIYLFSSGSSTVTNNTCNNNNHGIYLSSSDSCVVTYNLLQDNEKYSVYLALENGIFVSNSDNNLNRIFVSSSDNNLIHHNNFVDNNLGGTSQAFDGGTNNTWYDTKTLEGNYWSDWSGEGSYSIDGSENSIDLYPLDEPAEYSTIVSSTYEIQVFFTFSLLIAVVPLLLTKLFSRKRLKIY